MNPNVSKASDCHLLQFARESKNMHNTHKSPFLNYWGNINFYLLLRDDNNIECTKIYYSNIISNIWEKSEKRSIQKIRSLDLSRNKFAVYVIIKQRLLRTPFVTDKTHICHKFKNVPSALWSTKLWRYLDEWRYSSTVLNLGTRWRWVVSFTTLPL
jgi:hypothetical protein